MKKKYIVPTIELDEIESEDLLAGTVIYNGSANEEHSGNNNNEHEEGTTGMEGTGSDSGFILGSKHDSFSWDE